MIRYVITFLLIAASAVGQPLQQSGTFTPGHAPLIVTTGVLKDGGSAYPPLATARPGLISNNQAADCIYNAAISGAYSSFCFGITGSAAYITVQNRNGGAQLPLNFVINGATIPFPGSTGPYLPLSGGNMTGSPDVYADSGYMQRGAVVLTMKGGPLNIDPPFPDCDGNCQTLVGSGAGSNLYAADGLTTAVGFNALHNATGANDQRGTESTAVGWNAGGNLTGTGAPYFVTILGVNALGSCTTGCNNDIAIGTDAMRDTLAMTNSIAIGGSAAWYGTHDGIIAIGLGAHKMASGSSNSAGSPNMAIGNYAMLCPTGTTANDNVAIGDGSLTACTTAQRNVIVGQHAGGAMTTDSNNVWIGWKAGLGAVGANSNNAVGFLAVGLGTFTGSQVNAVGFEAGARLSTAVGVNAFGYLACQNVTTGIFNFCFGDSVGQTLTTGSRNILIATGDHAVETSTATAIGEINIEGVWKTTGSFTPNTSVNLVSGSFAARGLMGYGTKFTASGCSISATTGTATGGTFTSGTTGDCAVTVTLGGASGINAPTTGWACAVSNRTTANLMRQTGSNASLASFDGTTVTGDVIEFGCVGY